MAARPAEERRTGRRGALPARQVPPKVAVDVLAATLDNRANAARYLRHRWGLDVLADPYQFLPGAPEPRDADEEANIGSALLVFGVLDALVYALFCELPDTPARERGNVAAQVVSLWNHELPALIALHMKHTPYQGGRLGAAIGLAGWAESRISLNRNPRLTRALDVEALGNPDERRRVLRRNLPGAVMEAVEVHAAPGFDLGKFRNSIARLIEQTGTEQGEELRGQPIGSLDTVTDPATFSLGQQFAAAHAASAQEWAGERQQEMRALLEAAGLSPRQVAIMEIDLLEPERTDREIAQRLGVGIGTIKTQHHRAVKHLRRHYAHLRPTA